MVVNEVYLNFYVFLVKPYVKAKPNINSTSTCIRISGCTIASGNFFVIS